MTDIQITLKLPVLRQGSTPESGPTVIEHLQLMLNERGGFPIVNVDGDFGPSTVHRPIGQTLSAERKSHGRRDRRKTDLDIPPVQMAAAIGTKLNRSQAGGLSAEDESALSGIRRRTIGAAAVRKKAATSDIVLGMVGGKGTSLRELRDRAILLLGFSGAFRRSELLALNLGDIEWTTEGALVTIRRSKTDQEGVGRRVGIPRGDIACPVTALGAWIEAAGIGEGAVFRRVFNRRAQRVGVQRLAARNVASVVKAAAAKLGLDPATFGGHSLRSGLVTTAVKRGVNLMKVCDQTGHKSLEMLRVYSRDAELFAGNAAAGLL
jgi:integrase